MKKFRIGPLFTPPSLRGTIQRPTAGGGANWGGAGFDPETGVLYIRTTEGTTINQICKNDGTAVDVDIDYSNNCEFGAWVGFPRQGAVSPSRTDDAPATNKLGAIPLIKPPYARLVAIDFNKGDVVWRVPFGEGSAAIRRHPLLKGVTLPDRLGTPGPNSMLVTQSGLVFIGGGDPYLYAFDKKTGRELSRVATPGRTSGNPMTYRTKSGRQFIVIATGSGADAALVAFALPRAGRPRVTDAECRVLTAVASRPRKGERE